MGDSLHSQDGYPPGVSNSHPHFHERAYDDDDLCICGHRHEVHSYDGWGCSADGCWCEAFQVAEVERDEDSYPDRER